MTSVPSISLSQNGPSLSRLVYGCWRLHEDPVGVSPQRILEKIETCLELGIHSFDHADFYIRLIRKFTSIRTSILSTRS
ncbi:hypothetical protein CH375_03700, partial [Leptospira ellisii]